MDFPIHIDTISTELSILYFKELPVKLFYKMMYTVWLWPKLLTWDVKQQTNKQIIRDVFMSLKIVLILANSADPDEMPPYVLFRQCLHHLPK